MKKGVARRMRCSRGQSAAWHRARRCSLPSVLSCVLKPVSRRLPKPRATKPELASSGFIESRRKRSAWCAGSRKDLAATTALDPW